MNILQEEIRKRAGIISENVTAESLGNKLASLIEKGSNESDLIKVIDTLCFKDWIKFTSFPKEKLLRVSINPMGYNPTSGNVISSIVGENTNFKSIIEKAFKKWIENISEKELKKYPGFKIWVEKKY